MTAIEFITKGCGWPFFSSERNRTKTTHDDPPRLMSRGELKRHLRQGGAIRINGVFPKPDDEILFPIEDYVLFPKSKTRKCTIR